MHLPDTLQAPRSLRDWWRGVRRPPAERVAGQALAADPPPPSPVPAVIRPEPPAEAAGWRRLVRWARRLPPGAPVTVNAVARAMRCSRWDAWRWCHALEAAGEVESVALPPDRRGRPRRLWRRPLAGGPGHG